LGFIILLTLVTGFISGLLPGLKFASVVANNLLKNKLSSSSDIGSFRNGLVIFQLVITIFFLISSIVINRQSKLITSFNSGFNKDNIYYVRLNEDIYGKVPELRQILLQNPQILNVASASVLPNRIVTGSYFKWGISDVSDKRICEARVDYDFLKIFDIKLLAGRFFDTEHPSDEEKSILISETAYNILQEKDAIDKPFHYGNKTYNLIGVVKNYQHNSVLSQTPGAISYILSPNSNSYLFIKINPGLNDLFAKDKTIRYIHKVCDSFSPGRPLFYSFLNDVSYNIETQFEARKKLIFLATLLTILISIIGLFGLVYQSVKYRVREIGIRKINGAKVSEVMIMLNRGFIAWIFIAFVIATPIAWFAMHKLLNNYANKIRLDWWLFALAGLMAFAITILTVSWQSWVAASRNPVEVLRYE
jgi:putative ABC transport system permease protein